MGKFLTGQARIEQTNKKRIWKLVENELYQDDDNKLYIVPRTMYTDNYTIPLWIDFLVGGGTDYAVVASHVHDLACYCRELPVLDLTVEQLIERGFLKFNEERGCYLCENIPAEFIHKEPFDKKQANDILYRCMLAAEVPLKAAKKIRLGVCFNAGWYVDLWTKKVFSLDLDRMYSEEYWDERVRGK